LPLPDRLLVVIDDSPTKRYGPKVEGADIHRNPTPGPADQKYLYGHIWVTLSLALRHPRWGPLALPLRAMLYVRQKTIPTIPKRRKWKFRTKLELAARLLEWLTPLVEKAGKTLWAVVDGGYSKLPFLKRALAARVVVVGRLRKDAALRGLPRPLRRGQRRGRGRPRKYGKNKLSPATRAGQKRGWQTVACTVYNETVIKTHKTFLATYRPAGGVIRVSWSRKLTAASPSSAPILRPPRWRFSKPSPTGRPSSRTFTTSRRCGTRASNKYATSGPTSPYII
jgi:hypothetical protein